MMSISSNFSPLKLQLASPRSGLFIYLFIFDKFFYHGQRQLKCFQNLHHFSFKFLVKSVGVSLGSIRKLIVLPWL